MIYRPITIPIYPLSIETTGKLNIISIVSFEDVAIGATTQDLKVNCYS